MSESEEKMEVEQPPAAADLEALKANARDIVEKAGSGKEDTSVHENGDTGNGNGQPEEADLVNGDSDKNGDKSESEAEVMEVDEPVNGEGEENGEENGDNDEEGEEVEAQKSVNGNSADDRNKVSSDDKKVSDGDDKIEDDDSKKEESDEKDEVVEEETSTTEGKADLDKLETTPKKTPKKKKKVEEVSLDDSPPLRRSSRKKTPTKYAELERDIELVEEVEEVQQVEEIKDDDSDIQEVEPEDPLGGASISITKSTKTAGSKKPNVVTIDDLKTLQLLATSAKKSVDDQKKENLTIIDTQAILAGKMGSGVSITPAKPKSSPGGLTITSAGLTLGSGVTIKPNTPRLPTSSVTITSTNSVSNNTARNFSSPQQQQQQQQPSTPKQEETYDPNLTDDTFVVEAPSFIVPYVYEKPPKEGIKDFIDSVKKIQEDTVKKEEEEKEKAKKEKEEETKKRREERQKKRDAGEEVEDDTEDESEDKKEETKDEEDSDKKDDSVKKEDEEKKEETKDPEKEKLEKEKAEAEKSGKNAYFTSTLGKFFTELGMNLVQEYVQKDLLHQQKRRAQKDKSAAVMHAIMSLQKNLDDSREQNEMFHFELRKCKFCSFRTESRIVMQHHMETPHMKNFIYRCNFCEYETKIPQEVLFHMDSVHGVKGKLERAPYFHQCPQCPFEDNGKGKLTRHKVGCDKRFKAELNQVVDRDWDPPAKIKPQPMRPGYSGYNYMQSRSGATGPGVRPGNQMMPGRNFNMNQRMPMLNSGGRGGGNMNFANRGRPVGSYKGPADLRIPQPGLTQPNKMRGMSPQMLASQQMLAALNSQGLSIYGSGKQVQGTNKGGSPSISITPLPGRNSPGVAAGGGKKGNSPSPSMKPGQPGAGQGKGNFVICEICDGYIKDLEQLRNHMQWIHKVKIHPKMIYNRPPLNCQKCQFRFFTDQGLERHLLGSHGLVTASMQDSANKGQDSGRCPVCGKVYQWKLLNHVARDHNKTLKPAHLSYKCTVCTATFGQYKLFETHVYTAHSGVAKKSDKSKQAGGKPSPATKPTVKPGASLLNKKPTAPKPKEGENEVIDLDDEDEIDDVEKDDKSGAEVIDLETPKKSGNKSSSGEEKSAKRSLEEEDDSSDNKKAKTSEEGESTEEKKVEEVKDDD